MGNCCGSDRNQREQNADAEDEQIRRMQVQEQQSGKLWSDQEDAVFQKYLSKHFRGKTRENMVEEATQPGQTGVFKTEFFLDMYKCALFWRKRLFKPMRESLAAQRRASLKADGYNTEFVKLCNETNAKEEALMGDVTDAILDCIGMEHNFFQNSLVRKSVDITFMGAIQQLRGMDMEGRLKLDDFDSDEGQ